MIRYLNTDLDLVSVHDLTQFAAALETRGLLTLHVGRREDSLYLATFETNASHASPEDTLDAMLGIIEAFTQPERDVWDGAKECIFNIGYDCGSEPWAFKSTLSNSVLRRLARAGGALRITLYPEADRVG